MSLEGFVKKLSPEARSDLLNALINTLTKDEARNIVDIFTDGVYQEILINNGWKPDD